MIQCYSMIKEIIYLHNLLLQNILNFFDKSLEISQIIEEKNKYKI